MGVVAIFCATCIAAVYSCFFFACIKIFGKHYDAKKNLYVSKVSSVLVVFIAFNDFEFLYYYKKRTKNNTSLKKTLVFIFMDVVATFCATCSAAGYPCFFACVKTSDKRDDAIKSFFSKLFRSFSRFHCFQ